MNIGQSTLVTEVFVPLKSLSNFSRFFNFLLIKCELEHDLPLSKECIISEISITLRIPANPDANPPAQEVAAIQTARATLQIDNIKIYVPVVALSLNDLKIIWNS